MVRGAMTMTQADIYYDMYDRDIYASPYDTFRRLRNEAPVYFNEKYNECHGISYNSSNGAEIMTAIILTVAAIIALFIPR